MEWKSTKESRKGRPLPTGIYRVGKSYRAVAIVGGSHNGKQNRREKAFHQGEYESIAAMLKRAQDWQNEQRAEMRHTLLPPTVRDDISRLPAPRGDIWERFAARAADAGLPQRWLMARLAEGYANGDITIQLIVRGTIRANRSAS